MTTFTRRLQERSQAMPQAELADLVNRARKLAHRGDPIGVLVLRQLRQTVEAQRN